MYITRRGSSACGQRMQRAALYHHYPNERAHPGAELASAKANIALRPADVAPMAFLGAAFLCGIADPFSFYLADRSSALSTMPKKHAPSL
jgi:hypothetical protein